MSQHNQILFLLSICALVISNGYAQSTPNHAASIAAKEKPMAVFNAKRKAPKEVSPLTHNGIRYETTIDGTELGFTQKGGVLIAYDEKTGEKLWTQLVYKTVVNEKFERDVQDCHITSIELDADEQTLIISNERRKRFALKLADRSVTELE